MDQTNIQSVIITPKIGIARLGNSPEDYFLGPDVPGQVQWQTEGFKDRKGRIKRQGARFRIFGVDKSGNAICEITAKDAEIVWTVEIANKKASFFEFHGRFGAKDILRNSKVKDRATLEILPGPRSVSGVNKRGKEFQFDSGQFCEKSVRRGSDRRRGTINCLRSISYAL